MKSRLADLEDSAYVGHRVGGRGGPVTVVRHYQNDDVPRDEGEIMSHRGSSGPPAIEAIGLTKMFGRSENRTAAVDNVDLIVPAGGVYAVLGTNGAGKTTTVRMLATLLRPDAGTARIFGADVVRQATSVRAMIGVTGRRRRRTKISPPQRISWCSDASSARRNEPRGHEPTIFSTSSG